MHAAGRHAAARRARRRRAADRADPADGAGENAGRGPHAVPPRDERLERADPQAWKAD